LIENRRPKFFYGYIIVLAAFFIMALSVGAFHSFGVFFKPLVTEFGWTAAMTSGAYSISLVLVGPVGIIAGGLTDRFGPRLVLTAAGLFLGLGYLLISQIGAIWQLYLLYGVVVSIGIGSSYVPLISMAPRWFVKRRALMNGIASAGIGVGIVIMPLVATWLISAYDWRASYAVVGGIVLALVILAAQFLKRDPSQVGLLPYGGEEATTESVDLQATGFSLGEAVHTSQLWVVFAIWVSAGFCSSGILVHIVPHAIELGISATSAAGILAVIGGLGIPGRIIMGSIADRIGNRSVLVTSFILMAVALFWLMIAKELGMLYLFAVIFGFGYGVVDALESPMVAELFGLRSLGAIMGIVALAYTIGSVVGPVLAGYIFDITGNYDLAFLIFAAVSIAALILALLLRPVDKERRFIHG